MSSWFLDELLSLSYYSTDKIVYCIVICDLLVHLFFRLAFGVNVKPSVMRRFYKDIAYDRRYFF